MNKLKKIIIIIIAILAIFIGGVFVGSKVTYHPSVYHKYYTDKTTGVQYIVMVSKDGGIAIFPRLSSDGTLYSKKKFTFVENDIE